MVCGSDDHEWEQCIRFGGGRYDSTKDSKVLAAAERQAAKIKKSKGPSRPSSECSRLVEPPRAPPPWTWGRNHRVPSAPSKGPSIWYSSEADDPEEPIEDEPTEVVVATETRPPSPPNPQRKRTTFRPKATTSGRESAVQSLWKTVSRRTQRPPTPPRSKRALKSRSSGAATSTPVVVPPRDQAKDEQV